MKKEISLKQVGKGMLMSISAQAVSLAVSFILNLIVPKFIDELQYAYWQTYLLYISYVGILHFGLLDGIVLRYSQYDYDELDKPRIRSQFVVLFVLDAMLAFITIGIVALTTGGITKTIIMLVALGIVTRNVFTYTSYSFQITNRINRYATIIVAQRVFYGAGIMLMLFLHVKEFYWFCVVDLCADVFGILLGSCFNKGLYFGKLIEIREIFKETKTNVAAGILLLIANWASHFMTGSAKMIVQWRWSQLVFGKVSFAFSVSNLFLNFVAAISVVLFPSLKRMKREDLPNVYKSIRGIISPVLFYVMILYFPGCWVLNKWLPKYTESLKYLGILLPIIIFSSKVSLLTNNYLKAYREEHKMLLINLASMAGGLVLYLFCGYVLNDLTALLVSIVVVIMARSIASEIVVMKIIGVRFQKEFIIEAVITVLFMLIAGSLDLIWGTAAYLAVLIIYSMVNKDDIVRIVKQIKSKVKRS